MRPLPPVLGFTTITCTPGLTRSPQSLMPFGVVIARQKQHGRAGGGGVVGEALGPVFGHLAGAGQEIHVGGCVHGDHIGLQAIIDGPRLRAGACVGLVHLDVLAGGLLVVGDEGGVDVFVKLACHVIRHVQQRGVCCYQIASCQRNS